MFLEGTILKASMVIAGKDCDEQADTEEVAEATLMCLRAAVPAMRAPEAPSGWPMQIPPP